MKQGRVRKIKAMLPILIMPLGIAFCFLNNTGKSFDAAFIGIGIIGLVKWIMMVAAYFSNVKR